MSDATAAHILLVDDNDEFRESTCWLLEDAGFEVSPFASAMALLEALDGHLVSTALTCIVSDIRMPRMSGIELQQELKRRAVELPLVFVTAHADIPLAGRCDAQRRGPISSKSRSIRLPWCTRCAPRPIVSPRPAPTRP